MNRIERLAVLWYIISKLRDTGKTRLQKIAFLIEYLHNVPVGYRFRMHHYGPYSRELDNDIADLKMAGHISVAPDPDGYGYHLQPAKSPPDDVLARVANFLPAVDEVLDEFGDEDRATLELTATVLFVHSLTADRGDDLARMVRVLKPHFRLSQISRVVRDLEKSGRLKG